MVTLPSSVCPTPALAPGTSVFSGEAPDLLYGIARCLARLGSPPETLAWDRKEALHGDKGRQTATFAAFLGQLETARRFLRRLIDAAGCKPLRVTTDHHPPHRKAIRWIPERKAPHRRSQYLNNVTERDHRAVKQYYPMLGFGSFESTVRFCAALDELRQCFRVRRRGDQHIPLAERRGLFITRWCSPIAGTKTA